MKSFSQYGQNVKKFIECSENQQFNQPVMYFYDFFTHLEKVLSFLKKFKETEAAYKHDL